MKNFFGQHTLPYAFLSLGISIALGWVDRTWGVGYFLGLVAMLVNVLVIQRHVDGVLFEQKSLGFGNILFYVSANFILALPMLISGLYPDKSNLITVAAGELSLKYLFYIHEMWIKKRSV